MSTYGKRLAAELGEISDAMETAYAEWDSDSGEPQPPAIADAYARLHAWNVAWAEYAAAGYREPAPNPTGKG